jgi:Zn-dependent protease with chaperone function
VWDTSIQKATPDEISFIFGHEMGHYVLNHIYIGLAFTAVLMLVFFWCGYRGMQFLLRRFGAGWGIEAQESWGALIVLLLITSVLSFAAEPLTNSFSRWEEHSADVYGQEAMHGILPDPGRIGTETFQLLGEESLSDPAPSPFVEFWTYSHPSVGRRMDFAVRYDPWKAGEKPRYFPK